MKNGNHFDVFKKLKKKDVKDYRKEGIDIKVKKKSGFKFIQPGSFIALHDLEEYSYLQNGLYVSKSKLSYADNDDRADTISKIIGGNRSMHEMGGLVFHINWYKAKMIASELEGKLLTPAEYFCVIEDIHDGENDKMYKDMTCKHQEWLDCKVDHTRAYTHTTVRGNTTSGGSVIDSPPLSLNGWFSHEDVDPQRGFPKSIDGKQEYNFCNRRPQPYINETVNQGAIVRSIIQNTSLDKVPSINLTSSQYGTYTGMRLCKKVEKEDILHLNSSRKKKVNGE